MMDTKLPEARLPQEFILDAFADPSSVRDVVRGKPLLPTPFGTCPAIASPTGTYVRPFDLIRELGKVAQTSYTFRYSRISYQGPLIITTQCAFNY